MMKLNVEDFKVYISGSACGCGSQSWVQNGDPMTCQKCIPVILFKVASKSFSTANYP